MAKKLVTTKSVLARCITGEVKIMAVSDNCFVDIGFSLGGDSFPLMCTSVLSCLIILQKMFVCA